MLVLVSSGQDTAAAVDGTMSGDGYGDSDHISLPQIRWLKQQTFTFSQSWRLLARDHGVSRTGFS